MSTMSKEMPSKTDPIVNIRSNSILELRTEAVVIIFF